MIKFTKASRKDNHLVTVSLKAAGKIARVQDRETGAWTALDKLPVGSSFVLKVEGVPVLFTVNRESSTATTYFFPTCFGAPAVGKPVLANISSRALFIKE